MAQLYPEFTWRRKSLEKSLTKCNLWAPRHPQIFQRGGVISSDEYLVFAQFLPYNS